MGILHGLERRLRGAFDTTFARLFGGSVQPAEVTAALQREAATQVSHESGRAVVPNRYTVELGPSDAADVGGDMRRVSDALGVMLGDYVRGQGWDTFADVQVTLRESDRLHTGQFRVSSLIDPGVGASHSPIEYDVSPASSAARALGPANVYGDGPWQGQYPPYRDQQYSDPGYPGEPYPGSPAGQHLQGGPYPQDPQYPQSPQYPQDPSYPQSPPHPQGRYAAQPMPPAVTTGDDPGGYPATPYPATHHPAASPAGHAGSAPNPELAARLLVEDGSGRTYPLRRGSNIVGRGQTAALRLADTAVSREHLDVYFDGHSAIVHDLCSTNGTTVNGSPIQTWQLADGDVIRLGSSSVVFSAR